MKRKPKGLKWEEYLTAEDHLHLQVNDYLKLQYPNVLVLHVPNEGKRTVFERWKAKVLGMKRGWPDIMIFKGVDFLVGSSTKEYCVYKGLAIELKIKPNKPTINQLAILQKLHEGNWYTKVCYTFDEAIETINFYLKLMI